MDLHLNLKGDYFDAIVKGEKLEEYRLYTEYWKKRLLEKCFERIILKRGYTKKEETEKYAVRPWKGYTVKNMKHQYFGDKPVTVFAIVVNE